MNDKLQQMLIEVFQTYIDYSNDSFKVNYGDMNINDVHTVHYIGILENPNVTALATTMKITKGAITKITKKLIAKDYLETYQMASNKKERYFKLTDKGQMLFEKHKSIHQEVFDSDKKIFDLFNEHEKVTIEKFLTELQLQLTNKHKAYENK